MLATLQEMAHVDDSLAHVLWVLLLPIVWATLGEKKDQQVNLARPVIALIGKGYHERQATMRPNVVQVRAGTRPPGLSNGARLRPRAAGLGACFGTSDPGQPSLLP